MSRDSSGSTRGRKVLFIQHAGALGGSAMSLLHTMRGLAALGDEPMVALIRPAPEIVDLYRSAGFRVLPWTGIETFEHTTAGHLSPWNPADWLRGSRLVARLPRTVARTQELVRHVRPDVVHLNSAVLSPCAYALRDAGVPVVWHIREHPVGTSASPRRRLLRHAMQRWADEVIFISRADQQAWLGEARGVVVHNFVDLERLDPDFDPLMARRELGIAPDAPVLLFLGGLSRIKGVLPLLRALDLLRRQFPTLRCLMPGTVYAPSDRLPARVARALLPLLGTGTPSQRVRREMRERGLGDTCLTLPFLGDVAPLFAASDVVVFPAVEPHFARPAIEAAAMSRPVVASRLSGIDELVVDGVTGYLVEPGSAEELAERVGALLQDRATAGRLGAAGLKLARERFALDQQVRKIHAVYDRVSGGTL